MVRSQRLSCCSLGPRLFSNLVHVNVVRQTLTIHYERFGPDLCDVQSVPTLCVAVLWDGVALSAAVMTLRVGWKGLMPNGFDCTHEVRKLYAKVLLRDVEFQGDAVCSPLFRYGEFPDAPNWLTIAENMVARGATMRPPPSTALPSQTSPPFDRAGSGDHSSCRR